MAGKSQRLFLLFFLLAPGLTAQETFSRRLKFIRSSRFLSTKVLSNGKYLVTGSTVDTTSSVYYFGIASAILNQSGEIESVQVFGDSLHQTHGQYHTLSLAEGINMQQGYGTRDGVPVGPLFWFNDQGDTLLSRDLYSPFVNESYFGADYINIYYSLVMPDSTSYISSGIVQEGTVNDVCIFHLDKNGNELWHYIYATEADPESCYALIPWEGGVMAAVYKSIDQIPFQGQLVLIELDSLGNNVAEISESTWNNFSHGIFGLLNDQNTIVCAGGVCEMPDATSRCAIWKLNSDGTLIWSTPIGNYPESNTAYTLWTLDKLTDGNYITSENHYYYVTGLDSFIDVRLYKIDQDNGDLLWERTYTYLDTQGAYHDAYDLKATPDGGMVFCGEATDTWLENPNLELPTQQGWIVKLDACGCLVPGCDENCIVSVDEKNADDVSLFKVGPTPSHDFINIYLPTIQGSDANQLQFTLTNMQGQIVRHFQPHRMDTTFMVDTSELAGGMYILTLREQGDVVQQVKVVVEK